MRSPVYQEHSRKDLVSFSRVMAGFFMLLSIFFFWKNGFSPNPKVHLMVGISIGWAMWGFVAPLSLRPLFHLWMWLAFVLNFMMTRLLLGALFFGVMLPIATLMRLGGKDFLGMRGSFTSYWKKRGEKTPSSHFEKLYTVAGQTTPPSGQANSDTKRTVKD